MHGALHHLELLERATGSGRAARREQRARGPGAEEDVGEDQRRARPRPSEHHAGPGEVAHDAGPRARRPRRRARRARRSRGCGRWRRRRATWSSSRSAASCRAPARRRRRCCWEEVVEEGRDQVRGRQAPQRRVDPQRLEQHAPAPGREREHGHVAEHRGRPAAGGRPTGRAARARAGRCVEKR